VTALYTCGSTDEATVAANGLIDTAEASGNPWVLAYTLAVCGVAFGDTDPHRALEALRRSVLVAQDSGNRFYETTFSYWLARREAEQGDQVAALEYLAVAIHNYHESGKHRHVACSVAILATLLDRLGRYEPAATIAGFAAVNSMAATTCPNSAQQLPASARSLANRHTSRSPARARR